MVISSIKPHKLYSPFPNIPNTAHPYDTGMKNNTRIKLWQSNPLNHINPTPTFQTSLTPRILVARVLKIIPANNRKQSIVSWGEDSSTDTKTNTDTNTVTNTVTDTVTNTVTDTDTVTDTNTETATIRAPACMQNSNISRCKQKRI